MQEEGRIEIERELKILGPFDPAEEMVRGELVAIDALAVRFGVAGVQIDPLAAGDDARAISKSERSSAAVRGLPG